MGDTREVLLQVVCTDTAQRGTRLATHTPRPLWSPALQDTKWITTPSLSSGEGRDADEEEGPGDRIYPGERAFRECHLS